MNPGVWLLCSNDLLDYYIIIIIIIVIVIVS